MINVRKQLLKVTLAFAVTGLALMANGAAYQATSLEGIAREYSFSLVGWEVRHLFTMRPVAGTPTNGAVQERNMIGVPEVAAVFAGNRNSSAGDVSVDMRQLRNVLGQQVATVLIEQGLGTRLVGDSRILFPPVAFEFTEVPHILAISPREKVELKTTVLLKTDMTVDEMERLETDIEALGLSAEVERIGGLALYPSAIPMPGSDLQGTLSTVAHEWLHQYFFFRPLGRAYGGSYEMTTVNETAAELAGEEIGRLIYEKYYGPPREQREVETSHGPSAFDFNREMKETRTVVDVLLGQGRIEEAESYMEERRQFLQRNGYYIRKLNQAYFAFHGSYGGDPAAVSPVKEMLSELRENSASLAGFVKSVADVSSYGQLEEALARLRATR